MRFFYDNLIDYAATVITASSQNSAFPANNVANQLREKNWRTGTSTALESVTFDLGSAKSVTSCIVLDHDLTASDTLIKIQGHTSDSWGAPTIDETLTHSSGVISKTFAGASLRYWRFTFTKS